jgi:hypothetical protein
LHTRPVFRDFDREKVEDKSIAEAVIRQRPTENRKQKKTEAFRVKTRQ